jgi:PKD repeat protein
VKRYILLGLALILVPTLCLAATPQPRAFAPVQDGPVADAPEVLPWLPDRIVLQLEPAALKSSALPTDKAAAPVKATGLAGVDGLLAEVGVRGIARAFDDLPSKAATSEYGFDRWYIVDLAGETDIPALAARLALVEGVSDALPDLLAFPMVVPNDTYYADQWGHDNTAQLPAFGWNTTWDHTGAGVGTVGFDSNVDIAWNGSQSFGDASVVIAIIDSGVDLDHPDLQANIVAGYDFGSGDSNPDDNSASAGHGTCCAGVAAAVSNNGLGVAGVAGNCKIMPLKVASSNGSMTFTSITSAINYAASNGADVISMSLGAATTSYGPTDAALANAWNAGVTILAATGNENASVISYPAINANVIGVGAASPCGDRKRSSANSSEVNPGVSTDPNGYTCDGERWWGSNYGSTAQNSAGAVEIIAPTIVPTTDIAGSGGYRSGDYEMFFNGTSCATPFAAGVAALIKSKNPTWTPAQIRQQMRDTAIDVVNVESGAGWDRYSGHGMIDAAAAVGQGAVPAPEAAFSASPTDACPGETVAFSDESTGDVTSWAWTFGDGATSTDQNPTHAYAAAGTYTVSLTVTGEGGSNTAQITDYITVGVLPTALFYVSTSTGQAPLTVDFNDTSLDADAWSWDFGDGATSTEQNPSHTYTDAGQYSVTFIALNDCGSDTLAIANLITVEAAAAPPVAAFSSSPAGGCVPLEVAFTDESTGDVTGWSWDFGDGASATEQNPVHLYEAAGSYDVTLIATSAGGADTLTVAGAVVVGEAASAAFALSDTTGAAPLAVTFTDQSTGGVTSWAWDFGDGATDTLQSPVHEYADQGVYTVTLIVSNGCSADTLVVADAVTVDANPLSAVDGRVPSGFGLAQNYPNPFNPSTTITYAVTAPGPVRLEVYDAAGRRVAVLVDEIRPAGEHSVLWQPRNLASGLYFARLAAEGRSDTRRLVLLK